MLPGYGKALPFFMQSLLYLPITYHKHMHVVVIYIISAINMCLIKLPCGSRLYHYYYCIQKLSEPLYHLPLSYLIYNAFLMHHSSCTALFRLIPVEHLQPQIKTKASLLLRLSLLMFIFVDAGENLPIFMPLIWFLSTICRGWYYF